MRDKRQNQPKHRNHVRQPKYYYLKLKENYFDEDAIVLLESMQDGILLYSNILLKLFLKSQKNKWQDDEGRMKISPTPRR